MTGTYYVQAQNLTRGWTLRASEGPGALYKANTDDPATKVLLASPFRGRWAFKDNVIPNPQEPERVSLTVWARSVLDEVALDLGDVVAVSLYLNDSGGPLLWTMVGRVTESDTDLVPTDPWASRTSIEVAGLHADLGSRFPSGQGFAVGEVWERWPMALQGSLQWNVGYPTAIKGLSGPIMDPRAWVGQTSAATLVAQMVNSWSPNGYWLTAVTVYDPSTPLAVGFPPGYSGGKETGVAIPDYGLVNRSRTLFAYASRIEDGAWAPPLQFVVRSGLVSVTSTPGSVSPRRHPAVSASACRIPTNVRRTREHLTNVVRLQGVSRRLDFSGTARDSTVEVVDQNDVNARGAIARDVDTAMVLRDYTGSDGLDSGPIGSTVTHGTFFLADAAARASARPYQALDVYPDLMPAGEAATVLPYLFPHPPLRPGGDGRMLRNLSLYGVAANVSAPNIVPGGFLTSGEAVIEGGRLRISLRMAAGRPSYAGNMAAPMTVGAFIVKTYATTYTTPQVDPNLRVGDLDMIGA